MKRLLLVGGGHAHLGVLQRLAREQPQDIEVTLVTPYERQLYSGMLPGWIAGHYERIDELAVPLAPLAARAGARLRLARVERIDLEARVAFDDRHGMHAFDVASIGIGPTTNLDAIPGALDHAVPLRPIEHFVETWQQQYLHMLAHQGETTRVSVIGGGAGGVELALAIAWRLRMMDGAVRVQIVAGSRLMPGIGERARALALEALQAARVRVVQHTAVRLEPHLISLEDGSTLASDINLLATGAAPEAWPRESGLTCDPGGFIAVDECLRSTSHPYVFAAGDCASLTRTPRSRSGVFAVRAGEPLARNLLAALRGQTPHAWRPQSRALYLLAEGPQRAIASWGPFALEGAWLWRWKDRIDRAFIGRHSPARATPAPDAAASRVES
jgi:pyridine nucleotide-disulfide oxidoreductase family protein